MKSNHSLALALVSLFSICLTVGGLIFLLRQTNVYEPPSPLWQLDNDPNPAVQFSCKKLNYDFRNCRNWFIECWSSQKFQINYCVQLNQRTKLNWNKPKKEI